MPRTATDPLILAAEEADAEAAAAEADALAAQASATAARARARAAKLRREAGGAGENPGSGADAAAEKAGAASEGSSAAADTESPDAAAVAAENSERSAVTGDTATEAADSGAEGTAAVSLSKGEDSDDTTSKVALAKDTGSTNALEEGAEKPARGFTATLRRVKPPRVRRPGGRTLGRALVVVVVLLSLVAGGYSIWNHQQITADQAREDEFLNAAREGVVALTTLDSGKAADDVKRVLDHSTGAFRTDFQTRSEDFTKVVEQSKVATQGEITAAAVESMTDESAVVLVSAVSRVTNTAGAQQEPRVWRLSVTVTREGSELKMSKVEFVP
ncbi:hypothetical protein [Nocardia sp. NPDC051750]|uniref:hypothetical protein n=1 Tax=Nocardia sp. NPDC051750 TaxID=3364325 RepID=UPI0037B826D4